MGEKLRLLPLGDRGALGPRTDVYGLGAVLYAALTGQPPIAGAGLCEVAIGVRLVYMTADGRYLIQGSISDVDKREDLTEPRRGAIRLEALNQSGEDQMVVFGPKDAPSTVTVFTDIDCGFCRRFHSQIADINKAGVRVRYMFYPRTGPGTESWRKAEFVWCAKDRRDALTRAKKGEEVKSKSCAGASSVKTHCHPTDAGWPTSQTRRTGWECVSGPTRGRGAACRSPCWAERNRPGPAMAANCTTARGTV